MVGGQLMRRWTSFAPAARTMRTILRLVVPRMMESSTRMMRLPVEQIAHRVELELDAEVAHALFGLDEGAADVVVADEAEVERDAAFGSVAERGGHAGVRHGHNEIGGHARFAGKLAAHLFAALLHPAAKDAAVGPGEVDMLEDAAGLREAAWSTCAR